LLFSVSGHTRRFLASHRKPKDRDSPIQDTTGNLECTGTNLQADQNRNQPQTNQCSQKAKDGASPVYEHHLDFSQVSHVKSIHADNMVKCRTLEVQRQFEHFSTSFCSSSRRGRHTSRDSTGGRVISTSCETRNTHKQVTVTARFVTCRCVKWNIQRRQSSQDAV